jgi:hypothetical protein
MNMLKQTPEVGFPQAYRPQVAAILEQSGVRVQVFLRL